MDIKTVLCFGDSNTYGFNGVCLNRFPRSQRWPYLLGQLLGQGYEVISEGLPGRTTVFDDPLHEGLRGLDQIASAMSSHGPIDLLLIMLGTNDTKQRYGATPFNIAEGLGRLSRKALGLTEYWTGKPNLLIIAPPPIAEGYIVGSASGHMGEGCAAKSRALASHYADLAAQLGCHFLNAGDLSDMAMNTVDYMHLTSQSHHILAGELAQRIPHILTWED